MLLFYVLVFLVLYVWVRLPGGDGGGHLLPRACNLRPVVATPRGFCSNPAPSLASGIRLLTLNAFLRPAPISHSPRHGGDNKDARLAAILCMMQRYDVVCLQEMWELYDRSAFCAQFPFSARSPSSLGKTDGGLLILSRYPITLADFTPLTQHATFPDTLVNKGFMKARIDAGGGRVFTVVNAHLQATYTECEGVEAQMKQLEYVCAQTAHEPNLIVCGDFNADALEQRVRARTRSILYPLVDAAPQEPTITCVYDAITGQEMCTTRSTCPSCSQEYPAASNSQYTVRNRRLDYMCASPTVHLSACAVVPDIVSDHCALEAVVNVEAVHQDSPDLR
jgi:endonuclease/exonuclease/phosphatase family metal-dependent hydrolase